MACKSRAETLACKYAGGYSKRMRDRSFEPVKVHCSIGNAAVVRRRRSDAVFIRDTVDEILARKLEVSRDAIGLRLRRNPSQHLALRVCQKSYCFTDVAGGIPAREQLCLRVFPGRTPLSPTQNGYCRFRQFIE